MNWIEWNGGECPVIGDMLVDVRLRCGTARLCVLACSVNWTHTDSSFDVLSYRLAPVKQNCKDPVNHPAHYTQGKVECIDAIEAATVGKKGLQAVCVANVMKYLWRCEAKGGVQDVEKAKWYLDKLLENMKATTDAHQ